MEESPEQTTETKWQGRLALVFTVLFALFWSLGAFFFWILLAFSVYFGFLALVNSNSVKTSVSDFLAAFRGQRQPMNPYQTFRPRPATPEETGGMPSRAIKFIRGIAIFFIALFLFFFVVGLFVRTDDPNGAGETIEVSDSQPVEDGTSSWNERGNASLETSNYDSAFYYYNKALAIDPENTFALYNKGLAYTLQQDYRRANGYARKCVRFHPEYNPAWWLLGYNYDLMNNPDSALYCLEKAYLTDYSQPDFLQLMAEVYVKKDRRADALEAYRKLVTMDTTKADIFRKMAELDPANADTYRSKANALEK